MQIKKSPSIIEVLLAQVEVARARGSLSVRSNPVWVIICTDATPFWQTSATRGDVFVDVWGGLGAASHMAFCLQ